MVINTAGPEVVESVEVKSERQEGWPDKYRPRSLEAMALDPQVREELEVLQRFRWPYHVVISGPPATGKTTLAEIIVGDVAGGDGHRVLRVNASQATSIEYLRERIIPQLRTRGGMLASLGTPWREIVVFSEADGLSADAQNALKDALESYAATATVVFTTNHPERLNAALHSRCQAIELKEPPVDERARVLASVLAAEGVPVDTASVEAFAAEFADMRMLLREAQTSLALYGDLRPPGPGSGSWPDPVDGADLLDGIAAAFRRHLSLPEGAADALALWTVFAHAHEAFGYSPMLAAVSPVKRSGKTRLFEVLRQLVPSAVLASSISAASIYRLGGETDESQYTVSLAKVTPTLTLLADEGDTWLGMHRELRGILNSGHARWAAFIIRVMNTGPVRFSTWFPKAIALIEESGSELPPTLLDRSIRIRMQRKRRGEQVTPLRGDRADAVLATLRQQAERWVHDEFIALWDGSPTVPEGIDDRAADNWRPLLAIADRAAGEWPERARKSCLLLTGLVDETGEHAVLLLEAIRMAFAADRGDRMPTRALLGRLRAMEDRPWTSRLTAYNLAIWLRPFGIKPRTLWGDTDAGGKGAIRGYWYADFLEAFARYL